MWKNMVNYTVQTTEEEKERDLVKFSIFMHVLIYEGRTKGLNIERNAELTNTRHIQNIKSLGGKCLLVQNVELDHLFS